MHSPSSPRRSPRALGSLFTASLIAVAAAAHAADPSIQVQGIPDALAKATAIGKPAQTQVLHFAFALPPADRAGLKAYADAVNNKRSKDYRNFLTPAQVGAKFGPSDATVNTVTAYLKAKGFTIRLVNGSKLSILADATVKQAEATFSTTFKTYKANAGASFLRPQFYANSTVMKLPQSIGGKIKAISGASNALVPQPTAILNPSQTRTLYDLATFFNSGMTGTGVRVGMVNYDGYRLTNVPLYYTAFGLPAPAGGVGSNIVQVSVDGTNGTTLTAEGEADLDIQMILGMAPLSTLYIYDSAGDALQMYTRQASDNLVDILSESWEYAYTAADNDYVSALNDIRLQMTAQGITMMNAAGDFGAPSRPTRPYPYPHVDPEVLQVGGTIATTDSLGNRQSEAAWSVDGSAGSVGGGGGWFDTAFDINTRPVYQDLSTFTIKPSVNKRLFPDLSLVASNSDNSGSYYFYQSGAVTSALGTSFACPVFAGQTAILIQTLAASGILDASSFGRPRLGRMQDEIYSIGEDPTVFYDITSGNIGLLPDGTTANAATGWDLATGWGAPDIAGLASAYSAGALVSVDDVATSASVYSITTPSLTLGTATDGDATDLTSVDGSTYSIQSVTQPGVGQVAAATIAVTLNGDSSLRRRVTVNAAVSTPSMTVSYVYLLNTTTNAYDLVSTIIGDGTMKTASYTFSGTTDLAKYAPAGTTTVLVRSTKPARLGAAPFRMSIDQVSAVEKVSQS